MGFSAATLLCTAPHTLCHCAAAVWHRHQWLGIISEIDRGSMTGGVCCCRRMWGLLQLHAKQCQSSDCPVPRCRELREMRRRQMSRQEDQRRHAYQAMLRQQALARQQQQQQQQQSAGQFPERAHTPGY